jgi:predicted transcriptional regulator
MVSLSDEFNRLLHRLAEKEDVTLSSIVREGIELWAMENGYHAEVRRVTND